MTPRAGLRRAGALLVAMIGAGFAPDARAARPEHGIDPRAASTGFSVTEADTGEWAGTRLAEVDFGPNGHTDGGTLLWGAGTRESHMGWTDGRVRDFVDNRRWEHDLRDGVEGVDARFSIGVTEPGGLYRLTVWLADTLRVTGPVAIDVGEVRVASDVAPVAGARRALRWLVRPAADRVSFRIVAPPCGRFGVTAARLEGPAGAGLATIFPGIDTSAVEIPPPDALPPMSEASLRNQLRRDAEHLMAERLSDGRFSTHGAWYENSFPIRALVAAGELLNEPAWTEAAYAVLDEFVSRQRPDGNWASDYGDDEACPKEGTSPVSANLADIGTMTLALAIAADDADSVRRECWVKALVHYADSVSLPNQDKTGGFCNRTWQSQDYRFPYTVATATQVSTLAALYRHTGNPHYADAVARGTRWLADQVLDDGRIAFAPHDRDAVKLLDATHFGDCYYAMETLALVAVWTDNEALRHQADAAFDRWVSGKFGLRAVAREGYWWPMGDLWADSKLAGVPALLARRARRPSPPWLREMVLRQLAWLDDDARARRIGVRCSFASQRGEFALAATGFAGLSASSALRMWSGSAGIVE